MELVKPNSLTFPQRAAAASRAALPPFLHFKRRRAAGVAGVAAG